MTQHSIYDNVNALVESKLMLKLVQVSSKILSSTKNTNILKCFCSHSKSTVCICSVLPGKRLSTNRGHVLIK